MIDRKQILINDIKDIKSKINKSNIFLKKKIIL
jgi:hypothetical protein